MTALTRRVARVERAGDEPSPRSATRDGLRRFGHGELGALPVVLGLIVVTIIFQVASERFLSPQNLFNLSQQIAPTGVIALGIVFVLLIGEIDLSAGSVSGVTSATMAVLSVNHGWDPTVAILAALVFGAGIGLLHGIIFTKLGVPSFVLTLGGLLTWQGVQLLVLGDQGTINLPYDGVVAFFANTILPSWIGYLVAAIYFAVALVLLLREAKLRAGRGLPARSTTRRVVEVAAISALIVGATLVFSLWRGISLVFLIFVVLAVIVDVILASTTFGRKLFAVGGNAEAARRAGIRVDRVKIAAFVICSTLASVGGVLAASRLFAVNQSSGGSDTLLNAIAAAVIGGTSLFGGRGSGYSALLGMLVIGSVSNGMDLLNQASDVKYVITGIVLVAAVVVDSLSRRGRKATKR